MARVAHGRVAAGLSNSIVISLAWKSVGAGKVIISSGSLWSVVDSGVSAPNVGAKASLSGASHAGGNKSVSVVPGVAGGAGAVGSASPGESVAVALVSVVVVVVAPSVAASWVVAVAPTAVLSPSVGEAVASARLVTVAATWSGKTVTVLVEDVVADWGEVLVAVANVPAVLGAVTVVDVGSRGVSVTVWGAGVGVAIVEIIDHSVSRAGSSIKSLVAILRSPVAGLSGSGESGNSKECLVHVD